MSEVKVCKYCGEPAGRLYLICQQCDEYVHVKCCEGGQTPGGLSGDVFYVYYCRYCSQNQVEVFQRAKMTWIDITLLVLYNLTINEQESSSHGGYFHRNKHIQKFLNHHWNSIFPHMRTKRRTWQQMLSATLRKNPQYFKVLENDDPKNPVWYKLAHPKILPNQAFNQRNQKKTGSIEIEDAFDAYESGGEGSSIAVDQLKTLTLKPENHMYSMSYVKPSVQLSEFLIAGEEESRLLGENDVDVEEIDSISMDAGELLVEPDIDCDGPTTVVKEEKPKLPPEKPPTLLVRNVLRGYLPWLKERRPGKTSCKPMNEGEEAYTLALLRKRIEQSELMSVAELRLHRKLVVRKIRRERQMGVFNIDTDNNSGNVIRPPRVLDRFRQRTVTTDTQSSDTSFWTLLMGTMNQYTCITSPMTNRVLKAYIRQDYESRPLWLRLCAQIRERQGQPSEPVSPIVYTYVRPQHIPAVNSLAEQFFWPGINLSECLHYPDYSCVVLYKKLVVGFAFLVPDVNFNEAYISFILTRPEWRRAGIATFMVYHLIQTCLGKDITLHVSVTNPALLLYQKFGFKVEEFIQDFYDKYLPAESSECRHALFLRLSR